MSLIRVQPSWHRRTEFAQWATAQSPKLRTIAPNTFAVPDHLFTEAPEEILLDALVDGHRYVSPADANSGTLDARTVPPGQTPPELPAEAYGPDSVALPPPEPAPADDSATASIGAHAEPADEPAAGSDSSDADAGLTGVVCDDCGRMFNTERGLSAHRRTAHSDEY